MSDAGTRVLQAPQLRAVDSIKATVKIGDRQPTATGSYSSGAGTANAVVGGNGGVSVLTIANAAAETVYFPAPPRFQP